ncbi:SGNH/GDSL hydrolase family protein [Kurthia sibirica]|uniref:Esterase n=1 Tax=Kurthia sibirica TaxID=202750 RepID=A0A2U3APU7_9BACL|nr:GDSL-type esterase/lipase family protein [Kurthia sibirica]PWI26561.1 esterase [Kurthia sibirica]GEK32811.1 esterase [Kurthia sibirica]
MKILCFGDSNTGRMEGYPKPMLTLMLSDKFKGHRYVNIGIAGSTTASARETFKKDVMAEHPDIVTMMFGTNDVSDTKNIPIDVFADNIEFFIKKIGYKKVILITPAPVDETKEKHRKNSDIQYFSERIVKIAHEQKCTIIDFFTYVYEQDNYERLLVGMKDDGLHFGEKLYDELSDLIAKELKRRERLAEQPIWKKIRDIL